MKKSNKLYIILFLFIFTIINYFIYRKIMFPYLSLSPLRQYTYTPFLLISYLILSDLYLLLLLLQLINKRIRYSFILLSLIIYLPCLSFILFGKSIGVRGIDLNIFNFFTNLKVNSIEALINIFIFIPMGLFIKKLDWKRTILLLAIPISIEIIQYLFSLGVLDIADVLFNFCGILLGYRCRLFLKQRNITIG